MKFKQKKFWVKEKHLSKCGVLMRAMTGNIELGKGLEPLMTWMKTK